MTMTPAEFVNKADYEGGIEDAILGYGLTEDNLDDSDPAFKEAVRQFRTIAGPMADALHVFAEMHRDDDFDAKYD
ncbi:hypothetical protein JRC04_05455 [Mycolicibacterium sp. S2-37]|uniref:hypothetical protein n=1 Tax=Mycolicibacterium sp. S2-37 TaxID=2810297 RepID=UPI001A93E5E4|nr:hypothetical protein [Mycolicibacterium sp. S2-37]MBO0676902.1 hypothetical protein [Mycolicibacterium sp. S2-37]